jgi:hypothetical protein
MKTMKTTKTAKYTLYTDITEGSTTLQDFYRVSDNFLFRNTRRNSIYLNAEVYFISAIRGTVMINKKFVKKNELRITHVRTLGSVEKTTVWTWKISKTGKTLLSKRVSFNK